jgi:hypothetical protein
LQLRDIEIIVQQQLDNLEVEKKDDETLRDIQKILYQTEVSLLVSSVLFVMFCQRPLLPFAYFISLMATDFCCCCCLPVLNATLHPESRSSANTRCSFFRPVPPFCFLQSCMLVGTSCAIADILSSQDGFEVPEGELAEGNGQLVDEEETF